MDICFTNLNSKNHQGVIGMNSIVKFVKEEEGLTTVEYAIAGALVGAAVIAAFTQLGLQVGAVIQAICNTLAPTGGVAC